MNFPKKYYSILFAFVLLILIALQGYYIFNSYRLEEKNLKNEASQIALKVANEMNRLQNNVDEDKLIDDFKKLSHENGKQYDELNIIRLKMGNKFTNYTSIVDSLLVDYSKGKDFEIALKSDIYSIFDDINHKELLPNKPMVIYQSSKKMKNPTNINQSIWTSDDVKNEKDSDFGVDKNERHKYKIKSKTDFELLNLRFLILKKIIPLIVISLLIVAIIVFLYWKSMQNLSKQEEKINQLHLTIDSIAHELNTPITTMKFALQQVNNPETKDMLNRQIGRIENTVDSIFLKEQNENELISETNLFELIQQIKLEFPAIQFIFSMKFDKNSHLKFSDFQQIFQNLIENSVKYGASKIELDFEFSKQIKLKFSDDGIGIPTKDLPFIFDKYYRVDRSINQNVNGLGVGLYLVKNTVTRYNGTIKVQNNIEKGVEFLIELPNEN